LWSVNSIVLFAKKASNDGDKRLKSITNLQTSCSNSQETKDLGNSLNYSMRYTGTTSGTIEYIPLLLLSSFTRPTTILVLIINLYIYTLNAVCHFSYE